MAIQITQALGILHMTIERADRRNTITSDMFRTMTDALLDAATDPKVRVVLLKGHETVFSAGMDLEERMRSPEAITAAAERFFDVLRTFPKPIVAQVSGPAVGDAFTMLLYCDFVYCSTRALFSVPSVALALTPRFGTGYVMTAAAGYPKAAEKILLSEPISADEAEAMRLVTAVVEPDDLEMLEAVVDPDDLEMLVASKTARLAVLPPEAVAASKRLLRMARDAAIEAQSAEERSVFAERMASGEAKEAAAAFLEGRKPVFAPEE